MAPVAGKQGAAAPHRQGEAAPPLGLRARALAAARLLGSPRRRRTLKWLLAELIIVFLGVYGAVVAQGWRERSQDDAQTRRILVSLDHALRDLESHNRVQGQQIDAMLARFDAARARGERPTLPVYREPGGERPEHRLYWDALVTAGAARLLPPDLLFEVAAFVNNMDSFGERYVRYATFTEDRVLPLSPTGAEGFYGTDGNLRPEFAAHVDRLRDLRALERWLVGRGNRLRPRLQTFD